MKTVNNSAWFLVLPVFAIVAFSALMPLMTVVNYSVQDTFGNNQFFWNGIGWFQELLTRRASSASASSSALWRNLLFSAIILADRGAARHRRGALDAAPGLDGGRSASC